MEPVEGLPAEEAEQRALADAIRAAVQPALPSLIEFAGPSTYRIDTRQALASWTEELLGATRSPTADSNGAVLVRTPDHVEERLVAAILYRHTDHGYRAVRTRVAGLDQDTRQAVVDDYLRRRGRHDEPLRELEHVQYTFEVTLDGGALLRGTGGGPDIISTLTDLETALNADDQTAIQRTLTNLDEGTDWIIQQRSLVGSRMQLVSTLDTHLENLEVNLVQEQSDVEDADVVEAFSDVVRTKQAFESALQVTSAARVSNVFEMLGI